MPSRTRSLICRYASIYPRLLLRRIARIERRLRDYWRLTPPRRRLARVTGIVLFGCMTFVCMGDDGCACFIGTAILGVPYDLDVTAPNHLYGYPPGSYYTGGLFRPGRGGGEASVRPRYTGTDGSTTGTASFQGNFTAITQPSGSYFAMQRQEDCSLKLELGTSALSGSASFTGEVPNYERTLHHMAGLTSTADVYPKGCVEGYSLSTRTEVALAGTQQGYGAYALAAANGNTNGVFVLSTSPDYSSNSFGPLASTSAASALATADLNGDGNGDLVVVNDYSATSAYVTVILGNVDGTFQDPVNYPIAGNMSVAATIVDVNGDGKLDIIAVSSDQQISVLLGNGDGTFQAAKSFAAPALPGYASAAETPILGLIAVDVNGDNKPDLVCSNGLVLLGNGDGTFTPVSTPAFPYSSNTPSGFGPGLAAGDINNDGKIDLVVDTGQTISTYLGNGSGAFTPGASYLGIDNSGYVTLTDLDGDGNLDIYTGLSNLGLYTGDDLDNATALVLMGNGDGTFVGAAQSVGAYIGANLGDVNGDGIPDLITNGTDPYNNSAGPTFTVRLGNGKGGFTTASTITAPASFILNAGNTLTGADTTTASTYAVGDVNGDGKADLVFIDNQLTDVYTPGAGFFSFNGPVYFVALSNGDGTFQTPVPYAFPQNVFGPTGLQIADINHDGHNDLIVTSINGPGANAYNQGVAVLLGNGDGTFSTTPIFTSTYSSNTAPFTAIAPQILSITDLNGDGKPDLIVNSPGTTTVNFQVQTQLQTYIGNGDGTFKTPTTIAVGADAYGFPALADFNNDGKPDIAVLAETSASQAELVVALGNGDGTFQTPTISNLLGGDAIRSAALVAADFNGDGNVDLALLDPVDFSGVFYGNGNGTFTSVPGPGVIVPKDLINVAAAGAAGVAADFTGNGKPDLLVGSTVLLNVYGDAPSPLAATSAAVTDTASSIGAGSNVTFTATITPAAGSGATPTGTVNFLDGPNVIGTGTLSSGVATYVLTPTAAATGTHYVGVSYGGDTNFSGSISSAIVLTVTAATTATPTVTVAPSPSNITAAQALSVTVTLSGGSGNPTPTGSVTLSSSGYASAATTLSGGIANITVPAGSLATGLDTLTANYTPDSASSSTYNSASGTASVTVTALTSVPNVVGLTQAAASSAITAAGLTVGTVTTASSSAVPSGSVISQSPVAGSSVAAASAVNFVVSTGPAPLGFGVSASPSTLSLMAGATTGNTSAISLAQVGSFTGSVTLSCGVTTAPAGATSPTTCSLSPATAVTVPGGTGPTLTLTTTATTTAGAYAVTITGTSGTSTASTVVNVTVTSATGTGTFSVQSGGSTVSVSGPGASGMTTIVVNPSGGFTGSVALTAAITSSPSGAQDLPTLNFGSSSPVSITGTTAGTATLTIATTAAALGALTAPERPGVRWYSATGGALACLLFLGLPSRRRRLRTMLGLLIFLGILAGGVIGCGGKQNTETTGSAGTTPGNYTVTVTGATGNTTAQTTFALTVN